MGARDWLTAPLLPGWAAATALHPRLRRDLGERWGLSVPPVQPGAVWLHGASLGEIGAALALVPHLAGPLLLTADTDTGAARARGAVDLRRVAVGVRPVDHRFTLAPLWAEARPRAVVFVEGAWWPGLAAMARRAGVPIVRASARAGARTRRVPAPLYRRFTRGTTLVLARDEGEAAWFRAAGGAPVEICGDLKLCAPLRPSPLRWSRPLVVGASTRPGDETALIAARPPGCQLLLAPRHLDRLGEVTALLEGSGVQWTRRSLLADVVPSDLDVVLLDGVGELGALLVGAGACFVGGTFDPAIGGHSAAEAARAGVPVVAGPARQANGPSFAVADLVEAARPEDLGEALRIALDRAPEPYRSDAAERAAAAIRRHLGPPAPESSPRPWARPVAPIVGALARRRVAVGAQAPGVDVGVPVIAVGSDNARGPGKTSTVRALAQRLAVRGHRVGVVLRGYQRTRPGGDVRLSTDSSDAADLGDEGALHAADGHLVAAGADRLEGARALVSAGATVILLDDGLGDRSLRHARRILVVDARFPGARGPLPAGEGRGTVGPVDLVVLHHGGDLWPYEACGLPIVRARRSGGTWHHGGRESGPPEGPVAAFAGLGRAADLLTTVDVAVAAFRALPDHGPVGEAFAHELRAWAGGRPLVCTDKDAVRLPPWLAGAVWWRELVVALDDEVERWLP